jgi:hypothetical protein
VGGGTSSDSPRASREIYGDLGIDVAAPALAMLDVSTDTVTGSVHSITSQLAAAQGVPAETAMIGTAASSDNRNSRTTGEASSQTVRRKQCG